MPIISGGSSGGGSGLTLLGSNVLSGTAASLDVASIAATATHLLIFIYARTNEAANRSTCSLTFNGDSAGGSYHDQYNFAGATSGATDETSSGRAARLEVPGATGSANSFGHGRIEVARYANTTGWKNATWQMGVFGGASDVYVFQGAGVWASTAAINRVTLTPVNAVSFIAASAIYVYGI